MLTGFLLDTLATVYGETIGGRFDAWTYDQYSRLRANLAQLKPDANHDLQRAAQMAYWQAALQLLGERAEALGLNADRLLKTEAYAGLLNKFSAPVQKALSPTDETFSLKSWAHAVRERCQSLPQLLRPVQPLSIAPTVAEAAWQDYERRWLEYAILECWALLADIQAGTADLLTAAQDDELKLLFVSASAEERRQTLRTRLTERMQSDLCERFARLGQPSEALQQIFETGWYDKFRGAFHLFVKTDQRVANMLTNVTLSEILCGLQEGLFAGGSLTVQQLQAALDSQQTALNARFGGIEKQLNDLPEALRPLLAPLALATQNTQQFFSTISGQLHVVVQQNEQTHQQLTQVQGSLNKIEQLVQTNVRPNAPLTAGNEAPADWAAYHRARIAEWSQDRYALDRRFVNLTLLLPRAEEESQSWHPADQDPDFNDLGELLRARPADRALVLLGQPGSGKSTLLRHLQLEHSAAALAGASDELSFFIQLNDYDGALKPREWLLAEWQKRYQHLPALDGYLRDGRVLLLLDALNEMPFTESEYEKAVGAWRSFTQQAATAGNRLVFSCRSLDYSASLSRQGELTVPQIQVKRMDETQVQAFLQAKAPPRAAEIWQQLAKNPALLDLYRTPYFLDLLCKLETQGRVPRGRAELFTGYVRLLLERELASNTALSADYALLTERDRLSVTRKQWADAFALPQEGCLLPQLSALAFAMQKEGKHVSKPYDEACDLLAHERTAAIIKAGVALNLLDEERQQLKFFHQLLQEYFAARQLAKSFDPALIAVAWHVDQVSEPLAQTRAKLPKGEPLPGLPTTGWEETALTAAPISKDAAAFVRKLAEHHLPLAALCAASPELTLPHELKDELRHKLIERMQDPQADLRARIAAGEALGELGDPRLTTGRRADVEYRLPPFADLAGGDYPIGDDESDFKNERPAHSVTLAPFSLAVLPVTNAEYARFMRAGGYENEQWWDTPAAQQWLNEGGGEGQKQSWRDYRDQVRKLGDKRLIQLEQEEKISSQEFDNAMILLKWTQEEFDNWLAEQFEAGQVFRQPAQWDNPRFNNPAQPVVGLSWFEARAYANWLSAVTDDEYLYRLPTEVEIEAAARGRKGRVYAYGNKFDGSRCNTLESRIRRTTPVGLFDNATKPEGIYDLTGNVWTWTLSLENTYPYQVGGECENIMTAGKRVLRGGSWSLNLQYARAASRVLLHPADRDDGVGFRLVRVRPPS